MQGMKVLASRWTDSLGELKHVRCITVTAVLLAANLALRGLIVPLGFYARISFAFIAIALIGMLYGPAAAALAGGAGDIIGFLFLNKTPGPYFPGYTLVAILAGVFYGFCLYKNTKLVKGVITAEFLVMFICNIFLNTMFLVLVNGKGFMAIFPLRLLKNLIQLPINAILMLTVLKAVKQVLPRSSGHGRL